MEAVERLAHRWSARPDKKTAKGIPKSDLWATDAIGFDQVGSLVEAIGAPDP
jgi:hypothetical protein